jgi:hypothetical protein
MILLVGEKVPVVLDRLYFIGLVDTLCYFADNDISSYLARDFEAYLGYR